MFLKVDCGQKHMHCKIITCYLPLIYICQGYNANPWLEKIIIQEDVPNYQIYCDYFYAMHLSHWFRCTINTYWYFQCLTYQCRFLNLKKGKKQVVIVWNNIIFLGSCHKLFKLPFHWLFSQGSSRWVLQAGRAM